MGVTLPPAWRVPLLVLGVLSLAAAVAGGLARLTPGVPAPTGAVALHGPLMVCGFLGAVIGLERAVALGRLWAYAAPLAAGLGGIALVAGAAPLGGALLVASGLLLVAANLAVLGRQATLEGALLAVGAASWMAGNLAFWRGHPALAWWIAFFALTIGAERLELTRYLRRGWWARVAFVAVAGSVALAAASGEAAAVGAALLLLSAWLLRYDIARVTIRQAGLARYVAACLLAGYGWLAAAGAGLLLHGEGDAPLHAFFVGFVFSMVFGHAPVILPAVLRVRLPWHPALYAPLALLHASLVVRVAVDREAGAWGNAAAVVAFIGVAAVLAAGTRRQPP